MNKWIFRLTFAGIVFLSPFYGLIAKDYEALLEGKNKGINKKIYILQPSHGYFVKVSPFHEISLYPSQAKDIVNMVVEIPKSEQEKIEINKEIYLNPLTPDIRDGKVRMVTYKAQNQPKAGYPYHYGALPQTWEHIGKKDPHTNLFGDNDPIDAFDISSIQRKVGDIIQVKILGAIAMIDNGETDWKLIVINTKDPRAKTMNDINSVPKDIKASIHDFLENYKTPEGKPKNKFFQKEFWNKEEALNIVLELHKNWQNLCQNPADTKKIIEKNRPDTVDDMPECTNRLPM